MLVYIFLLLFGRRLPLLSQFFDFHLFVIMRLLWPQPIYTVHPFGCNDQRRTRLTNFGVYDQQQPLANINAVDVNGNQCSSESA